MSMFPCDQSTYLIAYKCMALTLIGLDVFCLVLYQYKILFCTDLARCLCVCVCVLLLSITKGLFFKVGLHCLSEMCVHLCKHQQFPQSSVSTKTIWGPVSSPMKDAPLCFLPKSQQEYLIYCLVNSKCACHCVWVSPVVLKRHRFHVVCSLPAFSPAPLGWVT